MDKQALIESAGKLGPFGNSAAEAYLKASDQMVAGINRKMMERPDIQNMVPERSLEMMKDNHVNHARFIASILKNFNPEVFVETILWVFRAYRSRDFSSTYWAAQINAWIIMLKEELPGDAFLEILPLYEWIQVHIPLFDKIAGETLESGNGNPTNKDKPGHGKSARGNPGQGNPSHGKSNS